MRSPNTKCTNELTKRPIRVLKFTNDWIQHFNKTKNICSLPQRQSNIEYLQPKTKFDKLELKIYNVVDELMWLKWLEYMAKHIFKNPNNTTNIFYTVHLGLTTTVICLIFQIKTKCRRKIPNVHFRIEDKNTG